MNSNPKVKKVDVGGVAIGGDAPLALIAGPCVIESRDHALKLGADIQKIAAAAGIPYVFKASYDKANRSSVKSYRGPGLEKGLKILAEIRKELGVPVLTDIHSEEQVTPVAEVVDILQIPAFLCRQTDILVAAAKTGKVVNVKKGQFMAPWDMKNVCEKVSLAGNEKILLTERGASFGYNNLVSDMRSLVVMRGFGYPVIFDATHSVQLPGGLGNATGGQREFIEPLSRAAAATGIDALFVETHNDPDHALSDGPNALPLDRLAEFLQTVKRISEAARQ
ncbi:MAG: 3-deoxy-8-phosphooctulonate synthase [Candidatus Sumerlaeaceae bacterium]|nr:3-deoxy-8-phosphooctulonate synthase [Candidatus Sumerlaeaceae bacterium]